MAHVKQGMWFYPITGGRLPAVVNEVHGNKVDLLIDEDGVVFSRVGVPVGVTQGADYATEPAIDDLVDIDRITADRRYTLGPDFGAGEDDAE